MIVVYSYERAVFVVYATLVYLSQLMGSHGGGGRGDSDLCTSVTVLLTSVYIRSAGGGGVGGEVRGGFGGNRHDTFCFDSALIFYSK